MVKKTRRKARKTGKSRWKKGRGKFRYRPRSPEQVKKRATQQGGAFDSAYRDDLQVWRPNEGDHRVRVLPPTWEDPEHYGFDVWLHSSVGPDNQTYACPSKFKGKECPVCSAISDAQRNGQGDEDWAKEVKVYKRVLVWVIVRGQEKEGPMLWPMPWTIDREWTAQAIDKDTFEVLAVDDPEDGYDLAFRKEGTRLKTKYVGVNIARRSSPLSDDEDEAEKWLEFVTENALPECVTLYDADYIDNVFSGSKSEEDEDEDEDEDALDESEDEEEDEEDEEVDDEEEDDEDEEDHEEDEEEREDEEEEEDEDEEEREEATVRKRVRKGLKKARTKKTGKKKTRRNRR